MHFQSKYFDSGDYNVAKSKGLKLAPFAKPSKQVEQAPNKLNVVVGRIC